MAGGETVRAAAAALEVPERTAYRWAAEADSQAQVAALRSAMVSAAAGRLADGMDAAAVVLRSIALKGSNDGVKVRAARSVIELGLKVTELAELQDRVTAIEKRLTADKEKP
jgi:hypothetical protein